MTEKSKDPIAIMEKMMDHRFCHMHGPEHHTMTGAALLTAYKNAGGDINLQEALIEMTARGKAVPGGTCGFWGACGAAIGAGIFVSIITKTTPLTDTESYGLSNLLTSEILAEVGKIGGPRCCKRNSFLTLRIATDFIKKHYGVEMEKPDITCKYSAQNTECLADRCPFFPNGK